MKLQLPKYAKTINWAYHRGVKPGEVPKSAAHIIFNGLLAKQSKQKTSAGWNSPVSEVTYDTGIFGTTSCKESSVYNVHNEAGNAIMWYANEKKTEKTTRLYDASDCIALIHHFEKFFEFKTRSNFYQIGESNAIVMEYAKEWKASIFSSSFLMQLIRGGAFYAGDIEKFIKGTYAYKLQDKRHLKTGEKLMRHVLEKKTLNIDNVRGYMFVNASEQMMAIDFVFEKIVTKGPIMYLYNKRIQQPGHGVQSFELVKYKGEIVGVNMNTR